MAALWNLSFLLALLPITLLRFLHRPAPPPPGDEGGRATDMAAGRGGAADGRENAADEGRENVAARRPNMAARWANMAARRPNVVSGYPDMAASRANVAAGLAKMAAERDVEGGVEGSGGSEDEMEAGRGHKMAARCGGRAKMAAGRRGSVRIKMAARPRPADESGALIWTDELEEASAWPRPVATSKMAAGRQPANESEAPRRAGQSDAPARRQAGRGLPAPPSAPGGHDGRGRWRAWLGAGAAAALAAGEGGFLWAVLWRQLPAVTASPIGCRPGRAPCPPLACALPARADKMAALLGVAASAAVSLVAVAADAVLAAGRAWRGRGRGRGPGRG